MSIASLIPHLLLVSLSVFPYGSLFSGISHIYPYTFLHSLLLMAISSFSSPTLLSSISLHILLLVHYSITRLSLPLTFHPLALSYTILLIWKLHLHSNITSQLYKPTFYGSHLSHNMSYGSATTIQVFHLPEQRYSYSTWSFMTELLLSVSQHWNLHLW